MILILKSVVAGQKNTRVTAVTYDSLSRTLSKAS